MAKNKNYIRITSDGPFSDRVKVIDNKTGKEIPYIHELKIHCLAGNVITAEIHVHVLNGFDISVLPENVTVILDRGK